jgi:pyrroline-5-carboxylate reductase
MTRLALVGGGRMGEALLGGLLRAGWAEAADLAVVEPVDARRDELTAAHPGIRVCAAVAEVGRVDGVVVAVKPDVVEPVCRELGTGEVGRVLSIAAGVTLGRIEAALDRPIPVVRAMPNTPALVGAGAAAIAAGSNAGDDDLTWAEGILGAVGTVVRVKEPLLDAVTGLSGSGPAYVFLVVEALIEAGVLNGLPRDTSRELAVATVLGSARLLAETGDDPAALRAAVTSPAGTTAAGLRALEDRAVRAAFVAAVSAATDRSRQL